MSYAVSSHGESTRVNTLKAFGTIRSLVNECDKLVKKIPNSRNLSVKVLLVPGRSKLKTVDIRRLVQHIDEGGCEPTPPDIGQWFGSQSETIINVNLTRQTQRVLAPLTPHEKKVLRMRFAIGDKTDYTLEEVGEDFAVTRERIR